MVPRLDRLGLDPDPVAVEVGDDVELVDVEPEMVETLDAPPDAPHLIRGELLLAGQLVPELVVPLLDQGDDLVPFHGRAEPATGLEVEQLREDVLAADLHVVLPHLARQRRAQLTGLGIHEVRREAAGAAPEQHVRQRDVAPVEVGQVQPHQQHDQGVDQAGQALHRHAVGEERPVGEREREVLGEQRAGQLLVAVVLAAGDDADRLDRGEAEPLEVAQQAVLAERDLLLRLLDRIGAVAEPDDAHDVAAQAAGKRDDEVVGPLRERGRPGQAHERGVGPAGDDVQRHVLQAR